MSKLVEAAAEFLARNTSTKQTRTVYESEEKYPTSNHLHMDTHEGEQRHIIKGIAHSEKNANDVRKKVHASVKDRLNKLRYHPEVRAVAKKSPEKIDDIMNDVPGHHQAANDPKDSHTMSPKVHNSVEDYVNHHTVQDSEYVNNSLGFKGPNRIK
jgi:hypothetical protein